MIRINRIQLKDNFTYYEAIFKEGNLLAFNINDLICQLWQIYGFKLGLFQWDLN